MDCKTDRRGSQALPADLADIAELIRGEGEHQAIVRIESAADKGNQIGGRLRACALRGDGGKLLRAERPAVEISAEPLGAARQMLRVETGRSHAARSGPELRGAKGRDRMFQVFADLFARAQQ